MAESFLTPVRDHRFFLENLRLLTVGDSSTSLHEGFGVDRISCP